MTEILTESFCERCGTRYTFESARPRTRLKGVKVLSRGLKNFVLSDDTSIDEAMAAARSEADREASSHQLDAFHKTFNFCMSCRQYTCPNCWNDAEARCLSCAPLAIPELSTHVHDLPELRDAVLIGDAAASNGAPSAELAAAGWPGVAEPEGVQEPQGVDETPRPEAGSDIAAAGHAGSAAIDEAADRLAEEPIVGLDEPMGAPDEAVAATDAFAAAAADSDAADSDAADSDAAAEAGHPADKAVSQTLGLLQRFRPGQSLDAELDAYERERGVAAFAEPEPGSGTDAPMDDLGALQAERLAAAAASVEAEAIVADEAAPEVPQMAAPEPEMASSAADGAPEPVADGAFEPEPSLAPEEPAAPTLAAAAASDVVEQPTWRITAPDPTPPTAPGIGERGPVTLQPSAPARPAGGEPQWPARPEWPSASASAGLPFLGRPATPQGGIDALWAASNQELVTAQPTAGKAATGIQPCISCGLSLSATARFCRRCGTLQTR
jgi:ribosomal protein L40E